MAIIKKCTINVREGTERREPSYTVDGNVNWYSHYGEQYGGSLKKLKIELPYDLGNPVHISGEKHLKGLMHPQCSLQHCLQ